jgi:putative acetyltransferase
LGAALSIAAEDPRGPDGRALIEASDRMSMANYAPEERYPVDVEELAGPDFTFFVARDADTAVGCAALRRFEGYGELKRMMVLEQARRRGIGRALLLRVEDAARSAGLPLLRLETGIFQVEALALYRGAGFHDCARFGAYRPNRTSVYLEKPLAGDGVA